MRGDDRGMRVSRVVGYLMKTVGFIVGFVGAIVVIIGVAAANSVGSAVVDVILGLLFMGAGARLATPDRARAGRAWVLARLRLSPVNTFGGGPGESKADRAARREREKADRAAEKATRGLETAVRKAESALEKATERKVLGRYRKSVLYEDGVNTPEGWCWLSPDVKASVQDAGSLQTYVTSRLSVTRIVGLGVFALAAPKRKSHTVDTRELYLLVETAQFDSLVECRPDEGPTVRAFATAINNAIKQAATLAEQRKGRIEAAERALASARAQLPPSCAPQESAGE